MGYIVYCLTKVNLHRVLILKISSSLNQSASMIAVLTAFDES